MNKTTRTYLVVAAAALALPGLALAASESEANHPVGLAQPLAIEAEASLDTGGAAIDAVIGSNSGAPAQDLDFFTFNGQAGDVVTLDIDGGMGGTRSVDTILAVFGPAPAYALLRTNDDAGYPLDPGSTHPYDSRIVNFKLPATGTYTVGVSSYPRRFVNGGTVSSSSLGSNANGDYTLLVSGVSVPVLQISIDIKPGSGDVAPINPKARGRIPVALLGASDFVAGEVDTDTLTFGHSGNERSLARCGEPEDISGDAFPDLVCHFENQAAAWTPSDDEAILKGKLESGRLFEGRGWLKVVPVKAQY